jgi:hypothetical protein
MFTEKEKSCGWEPCMCETCKQLIEPVFSASVDTYNDGENCVSVSDGISRHVLNVGSVVRVPLLGLRVDVSFVVDKVLCDGRMVVRVVE